MVTTDDAAAADRLRRLRSHAASTSDLWRHASGTTEFEVYEELGYNCRMTDIQAAIGSVQMSRLSTILGERRRLAERYSALLRGHDQLQPPCEPPTYQHTYQSYCIRLLADRGARRGHVMSALASQGIATRKGVMATHLEPYYRALAPELCLPITERAAAETMLLPLYAGMSDADQLRVVDALVGALD